MTRTYRTRNYICSIPTYI